MKQLFIIFLVLFYAGTLVAQPNWLQPGERERNYPGTVFIAKVATGNQRSGETQAGAEERLRKDALAYVTEAIRVKVSSESQKIDSRIKELVTGQEERERIESIFTKEIKTVATIELTGVKTDSYTDAGKGLVYGFACVNKYELTGYYNAFLTMNIQQLESALNTAKKLKDDGEKAKARKQYEETVPLLVKTEYAQDVLLSLDHNANLQLNKTLQYSRDIILGLAQTQGIFVFVESTEDIFGENKSLIRDEVTKILSKSYSFTTDKSQADFILKMNAKARKHPNPNPGSTFFSYADVKVELMKKQSGIIIYEGELSEKDGYPSSYEMAAREAFKKVGKAIANELVKKLSEP